MSCQNCLQYKIAFSTKLPSVFCVSKGESFNFSVSSWKLSKTLGSAQHCPHNLLHHFSLGSCSWQTSDAKFLLQHWSKRQMTLVPISADLSLRWVFNVSTKKHSEGTGFIITYNRQGFKRISHTHKWCSNFTVYKTHPRRLLKKKIATGFHRDSDSTNLGWGTGIFFSRKIWITVIQVVHALFFKELINSIRVDFFSLRITTIILIILSF